jgi:hypothetical protein
MKLRSPLRVTVVLTLLILLFSNELRAQPASYFEGGMMYCSLKKKGFYEAGWIPGYSIGIAGLEISLYGGQFAPKAYPDSTAVRVNGGYWNIGYIWRSAPRKNLKRFHYTLGGGVGGYGLKRANGIHLNLRPGIQINLTRNISIAASVYAGYNYFLDTDTTNYVTNGYLSVQKFFVNPTITLRLNTNPLAVMGESYNRTQYWGGGMVYDESISREGDYIVTRKTSAYLPAGEYITDAIITSTNYVNVYPKMLVGTLKDYKGNSLAFGAGVAFRLGILAVDIEHLRGQIGFHQSRVGSPADHWAMKRTSIGMGINWFNIPFPFRGPSIVRFILGARLGKITLDSNRKELVSGQPNPEELFKEKFWSPFFAFEFGTLGIHLEFFNQKTNGYASGLVLGATYLIPIYKR